LDATKDRSNLDGSMVTSAWDPTIIISPFT
jgi:hypothetical protein